MIVDDEEDIREIISDGLEIEGYNVISCDSVKDAIEQISKGIIDLIITDLAMPQMDGRNLIARIKKLELAKTPKIVVLSGFTDIMSNDPMMKSVDLIVDKPCSFDFLMEKLKGIIPN